MSVSIPVYDSKAYCLRSDPFKKQIMKERENTGVRIEGSSFPWMEILGVAALAWLFFATARNTNAFLEETDSKCLEGFNSGVEKLKMRLKFCINTDLPQIDVSSCKIEGRVTPIADCFTWVQEYLKNNHG